MTQKPKELYNRYFEEKWDKIKAKMPQSGRINYLKRYKDTYDFLEKHIHPEVEKGAIAKEEGRIYLNSHDSMHVQTLIERASELIPVKRLSSYEVYLFLLAAHFHDVGNIYGRKGHEKSMGKVLSKVSEFLEQDSVEISWIKKIAKAHGGRDENGNPADTLGDPTLEKNVGSENGHFRPKALAALLRFADELADDQTRAKRVAKELGVIPEECHIYHDYSAALHNVYVKRDQETIELDFAIKATDAKRIYKRDGKSISLFEEILNRTTKVYTEMCYCCRYMSKLCSFDRLEIKIDLLQPDYEPIKTFNLRLEPSGYPSGEVNSLFSQLTDQAKRLISKNNLNSYLRQLCSPQQ